MFAFFWTCSRAQQLRRNGEKRRLSSPVYLFPREEINERIYAYTPRLRAYPNLPSTPPNLSLSLFFLLASSIDIVVRPPLHLFPLFVSDLNLRPGYQLAVLLFALHQHQDLISVTVLTIGAVVIIFVFQPRPLVVFDMGISHSLCVCEYISRSKQLPISPFRSEIKERFPCIQIQRIFLIVFFPFDESSSNLT